MCSKIMLSCHMEFLRARNALPHSSLSLSWLVLGNVSEEVASYPGSHDLGVELAAHPLWLKSMKFSSCLLMLLFRKSQKCSSSK